MDVILTAVPWSGLGWGGLIFVVVLGMVRGDVVTRPSPAHTPPHAASPERSRDEG